jgi:hypothetical protein
MNSRRVDGIWRTPGKANSLGKTLPRMATSALRRWAPIRRMPTGFRT